MLKDHSHRAMMARGNTRPNPRRLSLGMSMIELLVGVAIGLFILAGASAMFVGNVTNSRRLLLEAQINQDLRSTMDLVARDLRRGAYWGNALSGTIATGSGSVTPANPYATVAFASPQILYSYTRELLLDNNTLDTTELFGFKLVDGFIQMCLGGSSLYVCSNWQTLTNTDILTINTFSITPAETTLDIRASCAKTCTDANPALPNCPRIQVRSYNIVLTGTSKTDAAVSRTLRSQVRVRNDSMLGGCPA